MTSGRSRRSRRAERAEARQRQAGAHDRGLDRGLLDLLVGRLGWRELFEVTFARSDVPPGRPAPFLIYRAMIELGVVACDRSRSSGDTPLDLQSGMNAEAGWVIGVFSGAHEIGTLGATPHTHLSQSVAELPMLFGAG